MRELSPPAPAPARRASRPATLLRDTRGGVAVEYIVIVGTVALFAIPASVAVGKALVESFGITREMLFFPVP